MIIQIWQAITLLANVDKYQALLIERVLPIYQSADGNIGVHLCWELNNQLANLLFVSLWSSRQALSKFSNPDIGAIANSLEEKKLLLAFEATPRNYDVTQFFEPKKENNS